MTALSFFAGFVAGILVLILCVSLEVKWREWRSIKARRADGLAHFDIESVVRRAMPFVPDCSECQARKREVKS